MKTFQGIAKAMAEQWSKLKEVTGKKVSKIIEEDDKMVIELKGL